MTGAAIRGLRDPERKQITVTFSPAELGDADIRADLADAGFLAG